MGFSSIRVPLVKSEGFSRQRASRRFWRQIRPTNTILTRPKTLQEGFWFDRGLPQTELRSATTSPSTHGILSAILVMLRWRRNRASSSEVLNEQFLNRFWRLNTHCRNFRHGMIFQWDNKILISAMEPDTRKMQRPDLKVASFKALVSHGVGKRLSDMHRI
jgi:hypothetical protein